MIKENVTQYLNNINVSINDFFMQEGLDCGVQVRDIFSQVLNKVNAGLMVGSLLLLILLFMYFGLDMYKNSRIKKLKEISKVYEIIDLVEGINQIQRIIVFACIVTSAWLFQIALWGL